MGQSTGHQRRRRYIRLGGYQDNNCFYCGEALNYLDPDKTYGSNDSNNEDNASFSYITPLSKGGSRNVSNTVIAHRKCNHIGKQSDVTKLAELNERRKDVLEQSEKDGQLSSLEVHLLKAIGNDRKLKTEIYRHIDKLNSDLKALEDVPTSTLRRIIEMIWTSHILYSVKFSNSDLRDNYRGIVKVILRVFRYKFLIGE